MRAIGDWFGLQDGDGPRRVAVLGCPFDGAATGRAGAAEGPAAIRRWTRSQEAIDEYGRPVSGLLVRDLGDVPATEPLLPAIADAAERAIAGAEVLLGLGGDHAVTIGLAQGVARRHGPLALVLLDAHADCFPDYDGDRESHACTVARLWESGAVDPARTAAVGLRSFAAPEMNALGEFGLVVPAGEWLRAGAALTAHRILECVGSAPLYVSIDIDVLDPAAAPGTGYPVAGGPGSRQLLDLLELLLRERTPCGLDLVEVAPALDPGDITAAAAAHVLLQVLAGLAHSRSGGAEDG